MARESWPNVLDLEPITVPAGFAGIRYLGHEDGKRSEMVHIWVGKPGEGASGLDSGSLCGIRDVAVDIASQIRVIESCSVVSTFAGTGGLSDCLGLPITG